MKMIVNSGDITNNIHAGSPKQQTANSSINVPSGKLAEVNY